MVQNMNAILLQTYTAGSNDAVKKEEFATSQQVLMSRRKNLKSQGLENKKYKSEDLIDDDEEEEIWQRGNLGIETPLSCKMHTYGF